MHGFNYTAGHRKCNILNEIGSRVGRHQATIMRICDRWMQEGSTDRHGRSHPPQCTTSPENRQIGFAAALLQRDNARPHVTRIVQRYFVNHQIELLPWPFRSPHFSPIENICFMVAQRLVQITPPAVPPDQL
ncbi:hypothetical protein TNCV_1112861 [Trichonephila clavipes]|uniref:Uncharacterized protein n=1 Tax=Trichonephila clavipes TaxID=2585209 RepID=A0A8X6RGZ6_TRICX|nr:hypothetical protein TNCV_1112861 [Trichonephila clavipes]